MIELRRAESHGQTRFNGVSAQHHFCYGPYQSPERINWGRLRTFNRLEIAPGGARPPNFLGGMEVLLIAETGATVVRCGGSDTVVRPGEVAHLLMRGGDDFGLSNPGSQPAIVTELWFTSDDWSGAPRVTRSRWHRAGGMLASSRSSDEPAVLLACDARVRFLQEDAAEAFRPVSLATDHAYLCLMAGGLSIGECEAGPGDSLAVSGEMRLDIAMRGNASGLLVEC